MMLLSLNGAHLPLDPIPYIFFRLPQFAHYAADIRRHAEATNRSVPLVFPRERMLIYFGGQTHLPLAENKR